MKKVFWLFLFLALADMAVIFMFSMQNAEESTELSKGMASTIVENTVGLSDDKNVAKKQIDKTESVLRVLAHASLFALLGVFAFMTYKSSGCTDNTVYIFILTLATCIIYSLSDEIHQIFVDGRTFQFFDIMTDTIGSAIGMSATYFVRKKFIAWFIH